MINLKTNCKRTFKYKAYMGFPDGTLAKNQLANAEDARDTGLIPRWGRSPKEGNGNPLQYSCLFIMFMGFNSDDHYILLRARIP